MSNNLIKSEMEKKEEDRVKREKHLYHNTNILLRRYRDVLWSIEASVIHAKIKFEIEMECKLEEFLELSYAAGADLSGTEIQEHMRTLERNKKMISIIKTAVNVMREKNPEGELFYWILYYTYLSNKPCKSTAEIVKNVIEKTDDISEKTYFRKRGQAIYALSGALWGYTDCGTAEIVDELLNIDHLK